MGIWQELRVMPQKGDTVRCVEFGDDYHRDGTVTFVMQGWIWVDYGSREERYQASSLEIYCKGGVYPYAA